MAPRGTLTTTVCTHRHAIGQGFRGFRVGFLGLRVTTWQRAAPLSPCLSPPVGSSASSTVFAHSQRTT